MTRGLLLWNLSRRYQYELSLYGQEQRENALKILFLKARGGYFLPAACAVTVCHVFTLKCLSLEIFIQRIPSTSRRKPLYVWEKRRLASEAIISQRSCFSFRFVGWCLLVLSPVVLFLRKWSTIHHFMCLLELHLLYNNSNLSLTTLWIISLFYQKLFLYCVIRTVVISWHFWLHAATMPP